MNAISVSAVLHWRPVDRWHTKAKVTRQRQLRLARRTKRQH